MSAGNDPVGACSNEHAEAYGNEDAETCGNGHTKACRNDYEADAQAPDNARIRDYKKASDNTNICPATSEGLNAITSAELGGRENGRAETGIQPAKGSKPANGSKRANGSQPASGSKLAKGSQPLLPELPAIKSYAEIMEHVIGGIRDPEKPASTLEDLGIIDSVTDTSKNSVRIVLKPTNPKCHLIELIGLCVWYRISEASLRLVPRCKAG